MSQHIKMHEGPRRPEGQRNTKGRGGSAKARQARKKFKRLAQELKSNER